jgi:hypothetical protein
MERSLAATAIALVAGLSALGLGAGHTLADQRDFTLVNDTTSPIVHLYIRSVDDFATTLDTGDNWLDPGQVIAPHRNGHVHLTAADGDGCYFFVEVDWANGASSSDIEDLCSISTLHASY